MPQPNIKHCHIIHSSRPDSFCFCLITGLLSNANICPLCMPQHPLVEWVHFSQETADTASLLEEVDQLTIEVVFNSAYVNQMLEHHRQSQPDGTEPAILFTTSSTRLPRGSSNRRGSHHREGRAISSLAVSKYADNQPRR